MDGFIWVIIAVLIIFLILALAIANYSGAQLFEIYEKYNNEPCYAKITGGEFALKIANELTYGRVKVARTKGVMTDAYSYRAKTVIMSDQTCDTPSVAALTIVAHEFGHAVQHLNNSKKFILNTKLMKITRYLGYLMIPFALIGIFVVFAFPVVSYVGFIFLGLSAFIFITAIVLKLVSIPLEKDASKKGIAILKKYNILDENEMKMAKELLRAALMTYIGDFLRAILWWTFLVKKTKFF